MARIPAILRKMRASLFKSGKERETRCKLGAEKEDIGTSVQATAVAADGEPLTAEDALDAAFEQLVIFGDDSASAHGIYALMDIVSENARLQIAAADACSMIACHGSPLVSDPYGDSNICHLAASYEGAQWQSDRECSARGSPLVAMIESAADVMSRPGDLAFKMLDGPCDVFVSENEYTDYALRADATPTAIRGLGRRVSCRNSSGDHYLASSLPVRSRSMSFASMHC